MSWQMIMLLQNALAAVFAVNSRVIARRYHRATLPLNLLIYLVIAASGAVYAGLHGWQLVTPGDFTAYLGFFVLEGVCFAISNILSYVVFEFVDTAIASLLSTLNIVAAVILSSIMLGEALRWQQVIGGIALLAAMELVLTINLSRQKHRHLMKAIILSAGAAIFFAVAATAEKYLLNHVNLSTYLTFGWGLQFAGVVAVAALFGRSFKANFGLLKQRGFYIWALPASFTRMYSGLLFIYSLKLSNNLSVIAVLSGLKVILAALLAAYLLKERDYLTRKMEAALLAAAGIALIYWR